MKTMTPRTDTRAMLARITPICARYGWQCDTARAFSTDERDKAYVSHTVSAATPNAIALWRVGRVAHWFLWDVQEWDDFEVERQLRKLEEVER